MKKLFDILFTAKFANKNAIANNILLLVMYRVAYPFSVILNKFRLSPNQITTLSTIFAFFAFFSLVRQGGADEFMIFWGASLLFDFCDGTVARMTNNKGKTAFRYDHISDILKINVVILGAGLRYNDPSVWVAAFLATFFFMYYTLLNHESNWVSKTYCLSKAMSETYNDETEYKNTKLSFKEKLKKCVPGGILKKVLQNLYTIVFSINGHTLLIFLLFAIDKNIVIYALLYLVVLSAMGVWKNINILRNHLKV